MEEVDRKLNRKEQVLSPFSNVQSPSSAPYWQSLQKSRWQSRVSAPVSQSKREKGEFGAFLPNWYVRNGISMELTCISLIMSVTDHFFIRFGTIYIFFLWSCCSYPLAIFQLSCWSFFSNILEQVSTVSWVIPYPGYVCSYLERERSLGEGISSGGIWM